MIQSERAKGKGQSESSQGLLLGTAFSVETPGLAQRPGAQEERDFFGSLLVIALYWEGSGSHEDSRAPPEAPGVHRLTLLPAPGPQHWTAMGCRKQASRTC